MLLYVCESCGQWHIFFNLAEMLKLSGQLGLVYCVAGCGLMVQVLPKDRLVFVSASSMERVKDKVMKGIEERRQTK